MDFGSLIPSIATVGGSLFALVKTFKFVKEGERGVLLTFGKANRNRDGQVKVIRPGFFLKVPFIQEVETLHLTKNTVQFEGLSVTLQNNLSYTFNAYIIYHVVDSPEAIENVLFTIDDHQQFVTVVFEQAIQSVMHVTDLFYAPEVSKQLKETIANLLLQNGIEIDSCGVTSFSETSVSQALRGIKYKIMIAEQNRGKLPDMVMATVLGAMPTAAVTAVAKPVGHAE